MKYRLAILLAFCSGILNAQKIRNTFSYEPKDNQEAKTVYTSKFDSIYQLEKIIIDGYDSKIPFFHLVNKSSNNNFVILLHGLSGSKERWIDSDRPDRILVDSLLKLGYNLIIPDAKFHGERSYELNFRPAGTLVPFSLNSQEDAQIMSKLISSTVKDIRIIMDFIELQNSEEKFQINLVGISLGGLISLLLNATETRIGCVVAIVPPFNRPMTGTEKFNWPSEISETLMDVTPTYYGQFQKSPVSLLLGETDFFTPEKEANQFFENIQIEDKSLTFFEGGHGFRIDFISDALDWITTHNKK